MSDELPSMQAVTDAKLDGLISEFANRYATQHARIAALEAERDALQEALEEVQAHIDENRGLDAWHMSHIIRKALRGTERIELPDGAKEFAHHGHLVIERTAVQPTAGLAICERCGDVMSRVNACKCGRKLPEHSGDGQCPRPFNNRPEAWTIRQCVEARECGCLPGGNDGHTVQTSKPLPDPKCQTPGCANYVESSNDHCSDCLDGLPVQQEDPHANR